MIGYDSMMERATPQRQLAEFTTRFNALLDVAEDEHGRAWSIALLKARMEGLGYPIATGHLSHLRLGRSTNPGGFHLQGLSLALGVTPLVWFDAAAFDNELERLRFDRDARRGHELGGAPPATSTG